MNKKIAVVLFNLGGPDGPEAVKPFLFNLFNDRAIIDLPNLPRKFLAKLISNKREETAKEIYDHLGGSSPILKYTEDQAKALEAQLHEKLHMKCRVFIAMRYWHPFAEETIQQVQNYNPDEIILLPLYPQFSTTTTGSSFTEWFELTEKYNLEIPTKSICCYPEHDKFIEAHAKLLEEEYKSLSKSRKKGSGIRVLFSAHGLPEKIIKKGDPYQSQIEMTAKKVVDKMENPCDDYTICYQSRVGPLKWIGPNIEDEIKRAGLEEKSIIIVPIAFVSEHSETLVELDIEYKEFAEEAGVANFKRIPTLSSDEIFINSLCDMCLDFVENKENGCVTSCQGKRICGKEFGKCVSNV